jgi:hypothetical protein
LIWIKTETVQNEKWSLSSQLSLGRRQAEKATQLSTGAISYGKEWNQLLGTIAKDSGREEIE